MFSLESFNKQVTALPREARVSEAARMMKDTGIGCVVIVEDEDYPVGMLTDRDLTVRVLAEGSDPEQICVEDVMTTPLVLATSDESLEELIERMRSRGVRRIPITREGRLAGIASLDEILLALASGLHKLGKAARTQFSEARHTAKVAQLRGRLHGHLDEVRRSFQGIGSGEELLIEELDKFYDRTEDLLSRLEAD
ncbi:MAG: CBS domain-containing protein [Planctomycetota bacterium]